VLLTRRNRCRSERRSSAASAKIVGVGGLAHWESRDLAPEERASAVLANAEGLADLEAFIDHRGACRL
jgi:hypothetical protein